MASDSLPRELGCSKCRYSNTGCSRCRKPSFRPRTLSSATELRQVVAEQRRHERGNQQALKREQRRQTNVKTGAAARETLIHRLRTQLGASGKEEEPQIVSTEKRRTARTAALPSPPEQPPSKYRRITRQRSCGETNGEGSAEHLSDVEMVDAERATSESMTGVPKEEEESVDPPPHPETGQKRGFLELLNENIAKRREARLSGEFSPVPALSRSPPIKRLKRGSTSPSLVKKLHQEGAIPSQAQHAQQVTSFDPRLATWEAPVSPYGLLEEELFTDPWKLLVACMLLNKTTGSQVRRGIWELFTLCPTPAAATAVDVSAIETIIQPLGLFRKRAVAVQKMSEEYLNKQWKDPIELYGIGQYAADAYYIFCRGLWREVEPEDKDLKRYKEWIASTGGLGTGLTRDGNNNMGAS